MHILGRERSSERFASLAARRLLFRRDGLTVEKDSYEHI